MLALVRLVGDLGGRTVMMHLGGRHIGTRPFKTKRKRVQLGRIKTDSLNGLIHKYLKEKRHQTGKKIPPPKKKFGR